METIEILQKARQLIADPANWIQEFYGRDEDGMSVPSSGAGEDKVCKWCAWGATLCIRQREEDYDGVLLDPAYRALEVEALEQGAQDVPGFNDTHTHKEVLALFDAAIQRLEDAEESDSQ